MLAGSTRGCAASQSKAASRSSRFCARLTVSHWPAVASCPRRSKVRHTQPRPAASRARTRSCSWLPPQPCTNRIPGSRRAGASTVPRTRSPPTAMSTVSSRTSIERLDERVLADRAGTAIVPAVAGGGAVRRRAFAVHFVATRAQALQRRLGGECLHCRQLRGAGAADAPGLFEHARGVPAGAIGAGHHVVVAAGGEEARERVQHRLVVAARADRG